MVHQVERRTITSAGRGKEKANLCYRFNNPKSSKVKAQSVKFKDKSSYRLKINS